jgi:Mrp family chromosome partitioning ATPase
MTRVYASWSSRAIRTGSVGAGRTISPLAPRPRRRGAQLRRCVTVAVMSPKGGVGKTTLTALLGSLFALLRRDRIVAIDNNPDFGALGRALARWARPSWPSATSTGTARTTREVQATARRTR